MFFHCIYRMFSPLCSGKAFGKRALKLTRCAFLNTPRASVQKLLIFQGIFDVFCPGEESGLPSSQPSTPPCCLCGCDLRLLFGWVALMGEGLGASPLAPVGAPCPVGLCPSVFELCHPGKRQLAAGGSAWLPSYLRPGTRPSSGLSSPAAGP